LDIEKKYAIRMVTVNYQNITLVKMKTSL